MSVAIPLSQQEPLGHKLNADSRATVRFNCGLATSGSKQQYSGRLMVTGMARALDKTALRRKNKSYKDVKVRVAQSCPNLCDPVDCTVHGILQARTLEWVAFPFSRGSSQPRDGAQVSRIADGFFTS